MMLASRYPVIYLDASEHYVKATYRNRCHILGPNGLLRMSVPIEHGRDQRISTGLIRIAYDMDWQKNHWMTLMSCYRRSAYFEFFEDAFAPLYQKRVDTLFEWNMQCIRMLFQLTGMQKELRVTERYIEPGEPGFDDFRNAILPSVSNPLLLPLPHYNQVFSDRFDFFDDLSVVDWIFNQGKIHFR